MSTEAQNQVEEQVATEAVAGEAVVEEGNLPAEAVGVSHSDDPTSEAAGVYTVTESETINGGEAA